MAARMTTGQRIGALLKARGMSQLELARQVGLSQAAMNGLMTGRTRSTARLHVIARVLGTTAEYLAGETAGADAETRASQAAELAAMFAKLPPERRAMLMRLARRLNARTEEGGGGPAAAARGTARHDRT